jgi:hypothetical protein
VTLRWFAEVHSGEREKLRGAPFCFLPETLMQNPTLDQFLDSLVPQQQQQELSLDDILNSKQYGEISTGEQAAMQPLVQESLHFEYPIQINVHQDHTVLPDNHSMNPHMLSPAFALPRNRSNSVTSGVSITLDGLQISDGLDRSDAGSEFGSDWGSDYGSNFGAVSPFPGAQIVQIPSPYIRAIHSPGLSPAISPLPSPSVDNFNLDPSGNLGITYTPFDDYLQRLLTNNEVAAQSPQDVFLQQSVEMSSLSQSPQTSFLQQQMELQSVFQGQHQTNLYGLSPNTINHMPTPNLTPSASQENLQTKQEKIDTQVPDGKFWNLIKKDGQTLYQCPWDGCEKSNINLRSIYSSIQFEISLSRPFRRETFPLRFSSMRCIFCS